MDNLAKEAMIARKAGMSYGRYKAMQQEKHRQILEERAKLSRAEQLEIEQREQMEREALAKAVTSDPSVRLCGICGLPLPKGLRKNYKYHTGTCADIAAERARERAAENKNRRARELYEARKKANSKAV